MADNLTVGSPGAGTATRAEASKDKRVDDGKGELERLRQLAKERGGGNLDDKTLTAIVERRKAKIALTNEIKEAKQSFETAQNKVSLANKADEAQTRAAKATGTQETKTADGLNEKDRTAVRSDPKAGPRLPPADAKSTTPEQAKALLGKLLETVTKDGQPFDLQAYAQTLKQRPATAAKQGGSPQGLPAKLGRESSGLSAGGVGGTRAPTSGAPGQRSGSTATLPRQAAASGNQATKPGSLPTETSAAKAGLGAPSAGASLSFRTTGGTNLATGTAVSADGLFNAGGGLITNSSFDGMHFNWDGFFALFLIKSQKDMQEWRKMMKELRRLEGEAAVQAHNTAIALLKMRQSFERADAVRGFTESLSALPRRMKEDRVNEFCFGKDVAQQKTDVAAKKAEQEVRGLLAKLREKNAQVPAGRVFLTPSEQKALKADEAAEYRKAVEKYAKEARPSAAAGQLLADLRAADKTLAAKIPEGQVYLTEAQQQALGAEGAAQYKAIMANLGTREGPLNKAGLIADAIDAVQKDATLNTTDRDEIVGKLKTELGAAKSGIEMMVRAMMADPETASLLNEQRIVLRGEEQKAKKAGAPGQRSLLRQVVMLDTAMAAGEPKNAERTERYARARTELKTKGAGTANVDQQLAQMDRLIGPNGAQPGATPGDDPLEKHLDDKSDSLLDIAAAAGDGLAQERKGLHHDLRWEKGFKDVERALRSVANDQDIVRAVDNAVQGAIAAAQRGRAECDVLMRQTVGKAQGMINQLLQLLAMSRSH
ncbi:MAG: hypothetical protein HY903_06570 [Deltaproteobacteria bacterium]|nr:hypothetical protein [Deltaproteobacteria bacterium]